MTIYFRVNVEHGHISKELRIVLQSHLILLIDHLLSDFFFNHPLGFFVIRISITQSHLALLLGLLLIHLSLHSFTNELLYGLIISRLKSCKQFMIASFDSCAEMLV